MVSRIPILVERSEVDGGSVLWRARNADGAQVGTLLVGPDHEIQYVETAPRFRRMGIATALLRRARADGWDVTHSAMRTVEGERWARSTGDPLPRNAAFLTGGKIMV